jgi:uncharacterized protein (DUF4213/DUF364 family)
MDLQVLAPIMTQLGVAAIFIIMLKQVYDDWKQERIDAAKERQDMLAKLDDVGSIKERITRIEDKLGIYDPPTLPKPPTA